MISKREEFSRIQWRGERAVLPLIFDRMKPKKRISQQKSQRLHSNETNEIKRLRLADLVDWLNAFFFLSSFLINVRFAQNLSLLRERGAVQCFSISECLLSPSNVFSWKRFRETLLDHTFVRTNTSNGADECKDSQKCWTIHESLRFSANNRRLWWEPLCNTLCEFFFFWVQCLVRWGNSGGLERLFSVWYFRSQFRRRNRWKTCLQFPQGFCQNLPKKLITISTTFFNHIDSILSRRVLQYRICLPSNAIVCCFHLLEVAKCRAFKRISKCENIHRTERVLLLIQKENSGERYSWKMCLLCCGNRNDRVTHENVEFEELSMSMTFDQLIAQKKVWRNFNIERICL